MAIVVSVVVEGPVSSVAVVWTVSRMSSIAVGRISTVAVGWIMSVASVVSAVAVVGGAFIPSIISQWLLNQGNLIDHRNLFDHGTLFHHRGQRDVGHAAEEYAAHALPDVVALGAIKVVAEVVALLQH